MMCARIVADCARGCGVPVENMIFNGLVFVGGGISKKVNRLLDRVLLKCAWIFALCISGYCGLKFGKAFL